MPETQQSTITINQDEGGTYRIVVRKKLGDEIGLEKALKDKTLVAIYFPEEPGRLSLFTQEAWRKRCGAALKGV
jgi:hypothetical protein